MVSVIVPVYGVENYLWQCLDSLAAQTLQEVEFLLIDDGSPDRCGEICDWYAGKDPRFRVFHKDNGGLSSARNYGLERAVGEWIMFVDGDDWVEPEFCEAALRCAREQEADLLLFAYIGEGWAKKEGKAPKLSVPAAGPKTRLEAMPYVLDGSWSAAWNKFCRRELYAGVRYPEGHVFEDVGTTYRLIWQAGKIWYLDRVLYHYRYRPDSIVSAKSRKSICDRYLMNMRRCEDLLDWGYEPEQMRERMTQMSLHYCIHAPKEDESGARALAERTLREKGLVPACLTWKQRIMLFLFRRSPRAFRLLCRQGGRRKP